MKKLNPLLSSLLQNNQKIKVSPLIKQKKLQEEALQIVQPITIEVNATYDDVFKATKDVFRQSLQHSTIAYTPHDDKILGVIVSSDVFLQLNLPENEINELPQSMHNIFSFLDICSERFYQKKQIDKKKLAESQILSQMMVAVQPEAAGLNLGVNMLLHNLQMAQEHKFKIAKIECTSKRSTQLGLKLDYEVIDEIYYQNTSIGQDNQFYWKDVPQKYNEEKLTVLCKEIESFRDDKYDFNQQNLIQFMF